MKKALLVAALAVLAATAAAATPAASRAPAAPAKETLVHAPVLKQEVIPAVQQALQSVVNIQTDREFIFHRRTPGFFTTFINEYLEIKNWQHRRFTLHNEGSGVLIDDTGLILTNAHVIRGAEHIKVTTHDRREYQAKVIGRSTRHDLALIQIHPVGDPPPIPRGDSKALAPGQDVFALGAPLGLQFSVTKGIVSALDRELKIANRVIFANMIQTDTPAAPGSSGGPLIDTEGRMVGLLTAGHSGGRGINFAVPAHVIEALIPEMKADQEALDWIARFRARYGLTLIVFDDEGPEPEFLITEVDPHSQAHAAGIRPDDRLIGFDRRPVVSLKALMQTDETIAALERVHVVIRRNDRTFFTYLEAR